MARQEDVFEEFGQEFIRRHRDVPPPWPLERVLVATDFSRCSLRALERGEELARRLGAELLLLHVAGVPVAGSRTAAAAHGDAERELAATVEQVVHHGVRARGLLREGAPDEEILAAAAAEGASLIVVGTHGRTGLAHVLLGSVAERVVRAAPCPVLTVGP